MEINGKKFISSLESRGLIYQKSGSDDLEEHLNSERTVYCGFDPTADSLHLGHLVPLLMLKRFQLAGHKPIALVGGATGLIGDPSFKATERKLHSAEIVEQWALKITSQIENLINVDELKSVSIINNASWLSEIKMLDFLRDIGKYFSINNLIAKESVKKRIEREGEGISYTEFSYSLVQALDFAQLYKQVDCTIQVGGSDQWGNIVSGIELNRRQSKTQCFGITVPLITKSDGTKFGKTESGSVWLDSKKTSPYMFYQFWLRVEDEDVYKFLNFFTFLSEEYIQQVKINDESSDNKPIAQSILAEEVTRFVHGQEHLDAAKRITNALFSNSAENLLQGDFKHLALDGLPHVILGDADKSSLSLSKLIVDAGITKSGREVKDALKRGAISINGKIVSPEDGFNMDSLFAKDHSQYDNYFLIKVGKKKHLLVSLR